jgi:nucleosome binding factor SPN SPT16 subunit
LSLKYPECSDCSDLFRQVTLKKTAFEIAAIRISAKFTEHCMKQLTEQIEHLIDQDDMK